MAQVNGNRLNELIDLATNTVSRLIPILVGVALIVFIWGLITNLMSSNEEKRKEGRKIMVWGIIAIFVMVSIWGIVEYIQDVLGIDDIDIIRV